MSYHTRYVDFVSEGASNEHPWGAMSGFTMMEILVTIIIITIGLMGMASLQAYSMSEINKANKRIIAARLATELADRIRANPWAADKYQTVTASRISGCYPPAIPVNATGCTPEEMAQNDLFEINAEVQSHLPSASLLVCNRQLNTTTQAIPGSACPDNTSADRCPGQQISLEWNFSPGDNTSLDRIFLDVEPTAFCSPPATSS